MLARLKNDTFEVKGTIVMVVAVYKYVDHTEYICVADTYQSHPYMCEAGDIDLLDDRTIPDWKEGDYVAEDGNRYTIASFDQWAENPSFLNWLVEDEWQPDKSKEARAVLARKVQEYIDAYASKIAGSTTAAKRALLGSRFKQQLKDHVDKGFERPDEPDTSDRVLEGISLRVQDLDDLLLLPEG